MVVWVALLFASCASPRSVADRAFARGEYEQAAELYEQLPEKPSEMMARMHEARQRAMAARMERFERSKPNLDEALSELGALLGLMNEWPTDSVGWTARVDPAVQWVRAEVAREVDTRLALHRPQAAKRLLARRHQQLRWPEFIDLRSDLYVRIGAEAVASCRDLEATAASKPFLRHVAAAYCGELGAPWPSEPHLPFTISGFDVDVQVAGLTDAQNERLVGRLSALLRKTVWYAASAPGLGRAHVEGNVMANFSVADVVLSAEYTEQVPYLDMESYQEPYQDLYHDTEYYTVSTPYTVWGSESYSCGTYSSPRTCTRSTSHTEYRSESKTRQVTRYRTAYRTKTRMVTRYRNTARTHEYPAREHYGRYGAAWQVEIVGPDWPFTLPLQYQDSSSQVEIEHDETFEPADLFPSHPTLRSQEAWFDQQLEQLTSRLADTMAEGWTKAFCTKKLYDTEEAARCVYGGNAPLDAKNALRTAFHGDWIDFEASAR